MSLPAGLVDVPASAAQVGCSRATLYKLMAQKKLDARKLGGKTVITSESIAAYLANLPVAEIEF